MDRYDRHTYNEIPDKEVVLLQSGGLDSNVLASIYHSLGFTMHHVFVDYGQKSAKKDEAMAREIAKHYGGDFHKVTMHLPWLSESSGLVAEEDLEDWDELVTDYSSEELNAYVPLRNTFLMSVAGSLCDSLNVPYLSCALDGFEDEDRLPLNGTTDKHPLYIECMEDAIEEGSRTYHGYGNNFFILAPLMGHTKQDIIRVGLETGADMSISTSCYNGGNKPCGKCSACHVRQEAFASLGMEDPYLKKFE